MPRPRGATVFRPRAGCVPDHRIRAPTGPEHHSPRGIAHDPAAVGRERGALCGRPLPRLDVAASRFGDDRSVRGRIGVQTSQPTPVRQNSHPIAGIAKLLEQRLTGPELVNSARLLADLAYVLFGSSSVFVQDMLEGRLAIVEPDIERIHPERHRKIAQQNLRAAAVQRFVIGVLQFNDVPPLGMFLDILDVSPMWPGTHRAAPSNDRAESRASAKARQLFNRLSIWAGKTFNLPAYRIRCRHFSCPPLDWLDNSVGLERPVDGAFIDVEWRSAARSAFPLENREAFQGSGACCPREHATNHSAPGMGRSSEKSPKR